MEKKKEITVVINEGLWNPNSQTEIGVFKQPTFVPWIPYM